jgi:hypothetical protein
MLRLYQLVSSRLSGFMLRHEKNLFTTGARLMAVTCIVIAAFYALRLGSQLFS